MRRSWWLILSLVLGLVACAAPPPIPPVDLPGWQVLYTRPGWQSGPAFDLRALGDLSLARGVATTAAQRGPEALLAELAPLLEGDLALANFESALAADPATVRPGPYRLVADPALVPALTAGGLDLLGLSNNHTLDAGPTGLATTMAALDAAGLTPVGAGPDPATALSPVQVTAHGLRVAVLALNDVGDPADQGGLARLGDLAWTSPDHAPCAGAEACATGRAWLSEAALGAVRAARDDADGLVVLVHWGLEYAPTPSARQQAWATRLVAAGADLVLGSHPHIVQPATLVTAGGHQGFVAYSLGNALFDGPADLGLSSGIALRALLDHDGVALIAVAPLATAAARPAPLALTSPEAQAILAALGPMPTGQPAQPAPTDSATPPMDRPAQPPPPSSAAALAQSGRAAWRWDGTTATPIAMPDSLVAPKPVLRLGVDLRGDGDPLWANLDSNGLVTLRDGPDPNAALVWHNEDPNWRFTAMAAGDPNDDGRRELLLLLWQPDPAGVWRSQPYLLGWRGGRYQIIWGGSPTTVPIQALALADLEGDGRTELIVLEGGSMPGDPGTQIAVWRWHGWGFQREWQSAEGSWHTLAVQDLAGEAGLAILAWE